MEAIFFSSTSAQATRIRSADDLEDEWIGEPLVVASPRVFAALAHALGLANSTALEPLRDATCQSFPVWTVAAEWTEALARVSEEQIDDLVEVWDAAAGEDALDADPYELSTWLVELQAAHHEAQRAGEQLFALFEEKAMS